MSKLYDVEVSDGAEATRVVTIAAPNETKARDLAIRKVRQDLKKDGPPFSKYSGPVVVNNVRVHKNQENTVSQTQQTETDSKKNSKKKAQNGEAVATGEKTKEKKAPRQRVRLVSTTIPGMWCRMFVDVVEKHGAPYDANGVQMVPGKAPALGLSSEQKAARKAEKEAEKQRLASMSDEEKLAYAKEKREKRQAESSAKKAREREDLIAHLKAEIAAGRL